MKTLTAATPLVFLMACGPAETTADSAESVTSAEVLLFDGVGASSSDVVALEGILKSMNVTYATASSTDMDNMTEATLKTYKLILWPGGNSITMGKNLSKAATALVHKAVEVDGVSYLGICAGAFMAETSSLYNAFGLAPSYFGFYDQNAVEMVWVTLPGSIKHDLVYWDGPQLAGFGDVVGKYPNGLPAVAEHKVGNGFVILSAVHPEAPASWRTGLTDLDGIPPDVAYAETLIHAALTRTSLPHY